MKTASRLADTSGFSLAEIMVASAILSVISLAMITMNRDQMRAMNFMEDKMSMLTLRTELKQNLLVEGVCKQTFEGLQVKDTPIPITINNPQGTTLFSGKAGERRRYDHLEIDSLILQNVDVPDHIGSGWVEVVVKTKRLREGSGPAVLRPAKARIRVNVDSDRVIRSCDTERVTALDCGQSPHGEILTRYIGKCPNRFRKRDICIGGIWLLYDKVNDPSC
jgi:prepilin-type N-terminal cleavage/methylation domain-containing protein